MSIKLFNAISSGIKALPLAAKKSGFNPALKKMPFDSFEFSSLKNIQLPDFKKGLHCFSCEGAIPLKTVDEAVLKLNGASTSKGNVGGYFLLDKLDKPLATSGFYDCAVVGVVDTKNNKQFLYHSLPRTDMNYLKEVFKKTIGTDFDKAYIIPGSKEGTEVTSLNMFKALRELNGNAKCDIMKYDTKRPPEVILYNGQIFSKPIPDDAFANESFEVSGIIDYALNIKNKKGLKNFFKKN